MVCVCVCGNLVRPADHAKPVEVGIHGHGDPQPGVDKGAGSSMPPEGLERGSGGVPPDQTDLYAGGINSAALRCTLPKAAGESWSITSTDVRGAFLLAPRSQHR